MKTIYFAGGCFWGTEHFMKQIPGVIFTRTGYANGHTSHPSYREVCTDKTGFAETVLTEYDEQQVDLDFLVRLFFKMIDPTSLNQQGGDKGTQYRTGIYYTDPQDRPVIEKTVQALSADYEAPIVVEILPLQNFYPAEDYHQDYLEKNPDGYCHVSPELFKMAREARKTDKHL